MKCESPHSLAGSVPNSFGESGLEFLRTWQSYWLSYFSCRDALSLSFFVSPFTFTSLFLAFHPLLQTSLVNRPSLSICLSLSLFLTITLSITLMASYRRQLTSTDLRVRLRSLLTKKAVMRNCLRDAAWGKIKGREGDKERWQGLKEENDERGGLREGGWTRAPELPTFYLKLRGVIAELASWLASWLTGNLRAFTKKLDTSGMAPHFDTWPTFIGLRNWSPRACLVLARLPFPSPSFCPLVILTLPLPLLALFFRDPSSSTPQKVHKNTLTICNRWRLTYESYIITVSNIKER